MNVRNWLKGLALEEYADSFSENGVDASLLAELSNEDLKDLGIKRLVDRKSLLKAIAKLSGEAEAIEPAHNLDINSQGERRQVTAFFADLAVFT